MRAELEAVTAELRRLRAAGQARVFVDDATLARLRETAARFRGASASATTTGGVEAAPPIAPPPARVATHASDFSARDFPAPPPAAPKAPAAVRNAGKRWDGQPIAPLPPPPVIELPGGGKAEQMDWLRRRVLDCPACNEHVKPGCKLVFGVGTADAKIFFCGEGPGADEERAGEPFVGPAGQLLTKIIQAMGLSREQVYIGNIMKWRPEMPGEWGNREPTEEEVAFSLPFLRAQLAIVRPKVIVALGKTAVNGLLGFDPTRKMTALRGNWREFDGTPLMPTFHPSYLLRNNSPAVKRQVWEDMLKVMERAGMPVSEKQRGFFTR